MTDRVSIFITNSEGKHFELTNENMAIMMYCDMSANLNGLFEKPVSPYDVIIFGFHICSENPFGLGYDLVQHCDNKEVAESIIKECRDKLYAQYERMMMIRIAKKNNLDATTFLKIETEYQDLENYEVIIH